MISVKRKKCVVCVEDKMHLSVISRFYSVCFVFLLTKQFNNYTATTKQFSQVASTLSAAFWDRERTFSLFSPHNTEFNITIFIYVLNFFPTFLPPLAIPTWVTTY